MPARKDYIMHYNKLLQMLAHTPYLSVGLDVGADFTWMSIALPNGSFIGKPFQLPGLPSQALLAFSGTR